MCSVFFIYSKQIIIFFKELSSSLSRLKESLSRVWQEETLNWLGNLGELFEFQSKIVFFWLIWAFHRWISTCSVFACMKTVILLFYALLHLSFFMLIMSCNCCRFPSLYAPAHHNKQQIPRMFNRIWKQTVFSLVHFRSLSSRAYSGSVVYNAISISWSRHRWTVAGILIDVLAVNNDSIISSFQSNVHLLPDNRHLLVLQV